MNDNLKIVRQNLLLLDNKEQKILKIKSAMYHEAALVLKKSLEPPSIDSIVGIYEEIHGKNLYETDLSDFALFCLEIINVHGEYFVSFQSDSAELTQSNSSIAYMKNSYSDIAYRKFAPLFDRTSAVYFPGFREVCEEVYYGRCTHAMIPIYSSKDGQLLSFRKLISKYDLKITYEADVEMNDDSVMRFSLLQKSFYQKKPEKYIDLSVVLTEHLTVGDFISACEILGASVIMTNSIPLEYSDDKYNLNFQLNIKKLNMHALYLFLEGAHIRYDVIGLYDVLI